MPGINRRRPAAILKVVIGGLLLLLLMSGCQAEDDSWERIRESGVLRVGVDPTFPPFALANEESVEGIDIDLARLLASELGVEAQFSYFGYDGLYDALTTGQVDVLISALVIVPERTKDIAYTESYYDAGQFLIIPAGASDIEGMDDLDGHTLAVELGAMGHVEALDRQRKLNSLTIQTYEGVSEALTAVMAGEADAVLVDSVSGRLFLREHAGGPPLVRLPQPVTSEPYAAAVRIEDQLLLAELNNALARITSVGELKTVIDRWLGP